MKKNKIIVSFFVAFFSFLLVLFLLLRHFTQPEKIQSFLTTQSERIFKDHKIVADPQLKISFLDLLRLRATFMLRDVKLVSLVQKAEPITIQKVYLQIPVQNFFALGKRIVLYLEKGRIDLSNGINFLKEKKVEKNSSSSQEKKKKKSSYKMPRVLTKSVLDVKIKDLKIKEKKEKTYHIQLLSLRDLGLGHQMNLLMETFLKTQKVSGNLNLEGTVTLGKSLREEAQYQLKAVLKGGRFLEQNIALLQGKVEGRFAPEKGWWAKIDIDHEKSSFSSDLQVKKDFILFKGIQGVFSLKDFEKYLGQIQKFIIPQQETKVLLRGDLQLEGEKIKPSLKAFTENPLKIKLSTEEMHLENANLEWNAQNQIKSEINFHAFSGQISLTNVLDSYRDEHIKGKVLVQDVVLSHEKIQEVVGLFAKDEEKKPVKTKAVVKKKKAADLRDYTFDLDFKNVAYEGKKLAGKTQIFYRDGVLKTKKPLFFNVDQSAAEIDFTKKNEHTKFKIQAQEVDARVLKSFLPQYFSYIEGAINGDIQGEIRSEKDYEIDLDVELNQGEIKGAKIDSLLLPIFQHALFANFIDKENFIFSDRFERLAIAGKITPENHNYRQIIFKGLADEMDIILDGAIKYSDQKSLLEGVYIDKKGKLLSFLKKEFGLDQLPLKFKGQGYRLRPDLKYMMKELGKGRMRTEVDKQKKKLQNKVQEKASKFLKKLFK